MDIVNLVKGLGVASGPLQHIEGPVAASRYRKRFEAVYLLPLAALLPHSEECVLHHIFGLCPVHRDAESEAEEPVAQRKHGVLEADIFHLSTMIDD